MGNQLLDRRADGGELGRHAVHLEIAAVGDDEAAVAVVHRDAVRHVVEGGVEARVLQALLLGGAAEPQRAVHALADRREDQRREDRRDGVVGALLGGDGGEDLLGRAADRDDQREILDGAVDDEAADAVDMRALAVEPAVGLGLEQPEHARGHDVAAGLLLHAAAGGADDAVGADHVDVAVGPDRDRVVELGEIGRVEARRDDAAEAAVGDLDAAGELDGRAMGVAADHRLGDEQDVVTRGGERAEMLAVADIDRVPARAARRAYMAVRPDDRDLDHLAAEALAVVPQAKVEMVRVAQVVGAHHAERAADVGERLGEMGVEGAREVLRVLDRGLLGAVTLDRDMEREAHPDQPDHGEAKQRRALRNCVKPAQEGLLIRPRRLRHRRATSRSPACTLCKFTYRLVAVAAFLLGVAGREVTRAAEETAATQWARGGESTAVHRQDPITRAISRSTFSPRMLRTSTSENPRSRSAWVTTGNLVQSSNPGISNRTAP